ncbi:hypothetical protein Tco_1227064 [Tanacetum coccineum]
MGRDTIQLEDTVSTISGEYLLEFTSWYGIPEGLHPELPGLEETIMDFPEGKVGVYTKFFEFENYRIPLSQFLFEILGYYQIHLSQLNRGEGHGVAILRDTIRPHEKSPLDFSNEDPPQTITERVGTGGQVQDELSWEIPSVGRATTAEVVPKTGECAAQGVEERSCVQLAHSAYGGKSLAVMGLGAGSISSTPSTQGAPTAAKSVSDPDPLSYAKPQSYPESSRGTATEIPTEHIAKPRSYTTSYPSRDQKQGKSTSVPVRGRVTWGVSITRGHAKGEERRPKITVPEHLKSSARDLRIMRHKPEEATSNIS